MGSLEAALLDCGAETLTGSANKAATSVSEGATPAGQDALPEDLPSDPSDLTETTVVIQISSQSW